MGALLGVGYANVVQRRLPIGRRWVMLVPMGLASVFVVVAAAGDSSWPSRLAGGLLLGMVVATVLELLAQSRRWRGMGQ